MAREGLRIKLSTALHQAYTKKQDVAWKNIRVRTNGNHVLVDLSVSIIKEPESLLGLFLVSIEPVAAAPDEETSDDKELPLPSDSSHLENELKLAKNSLQDTVEELETSNEELKSTNEELQSTNEELQSSKEELETSKEEMQSLNEELTTVNTELTSKIDNLAQSNNDMQNLLNSTDIATLFLDINLNVSRYTERVKNLVNILPTDVGRPFRHLTTNLRYNDMAKDTGEVLEKLVFKEKEIMSNDNIWYLMRIMPYRTAGNLIDGLVVTFVNIDRIRQVENTKKPHDSLQCIVGTVREPILILDPDLRVVLANKNFYRNFRTSAKQTEGELIYQLGGGEWDIPELRKLLERIVLTNSTVEDFEVDHSFPRIGRRVMMLNARCLEKGAERMILLAMEEVTQP